MSELLNVPADGRRTVDGHELADAIWLARPDTLVLSNVEVRGPLRLEELTFAELVLVDVEVLGALCLHRLTITRLRINQLQAATFELTESTVEKRAVIHLPAHTGGEPPEGQAYGETWGAACVVLDRTAFEAGGGAPFWRRPGQPKALRVRSAYDGSRRLGAAAGHGRAAQAASDEPRARRCQRGDVHRLGRHAVPLLRRDRA